MTLSAGQEWPASRVDVPVTYSPAEAALITQEAGIVDPTTGGRPLYLAFTSRPRGLIIDATDGEPGFCASKLLLRDEAEALVEVTDWLTAAYGLRAVVLAVDRAAGPYLRELRRRAARLHDFSIVELRPVEIHNAPRPQPRALATTINAGIAPQQTAMAGVEALLALHAAVFREQPMTTKRVHVYGEVSPDVKVVEAPVGTLAADLLEICGVDLRLYADTILFSGGPLHGVPVARPMGTMPLIPVTKTTDALLVVDPRRAKQPERHYPSPDDDGSPHNAPWAPAEIVRIEPDVMRVRVPVSGRHHAAGRVLVRKGDEVRARDLIAEPPEHAPGVAAHASIHGRVSQITRDWVEIVR